MSAAVALDCPACARFARAAGRRVVLEECPRCCGGGAVVDVDVPAPRPGLHPHVVERIGFAARDSLRARFVPHADSIARCVASLADRLTREADPIAAAERIAEGHGETIVRAVIAALEEHASIVEPATWSREHARRRQAAELTRLAREMRGRLPVPVWTKSADERGRT